MKKICKKIISILLAVAICLLSASFAYAVEDNKLTDLSISSSFFENDSAIYNHELCKFSAKLVTESNANLTKTVVDLAYYCGTKTGSAKYWQDCTDRDAENFFIVYRDMVVNGENYRTVIACISGSYDTQWDSNFDPYGVGREKSYAGDSEKGVTHLGFADARDYVYSYLVDFVNEFCLSNNVKLLITGHSRGAAAANLLSAKIIKDGKIGNKDIAKENVYSYTFATPNVSKADDLHDEKYNRIFNIVNPEDFVTKVLPVNWGFGKYGTTYSFCSRTNCEAGTYITELSDMKNYFSEYTSLSYQNYTEGEEPTDRIIESMSQYLSDLDEFYTKSIFNDKYEKITTYDFFKEYFCPFVNGTVSEENRMTQITKLITLANYYDDEENMVEDFINFMLQYALISSCFADAHEARTYYAYVCALSEEQIKKDYSSYTMKIYNVNSVYVTEKISGLVVAKVDLGIVNKQINNKNYSNYIKFENGYVYLRLPTNGNYEVNILPISNTFVDCIIEKESSTNGRIERINFFDVSVSSKNTGKFVVNSGGISFKYENDLDSIIVPNQKMLNDNMVVNTVNCDVYGCGNATKSVSNIGGNFSKVVAVADKYNNFLGWYYGEKLLSDKPEYEFMQKENKTLVAKFTNNRYQFDENCKLVGDIICLNEQGVESINNCLEYSGFEIIETKNNNAFGTGTKVEIKLDNQIIKTYFVAVMGDLNGDGYVDSFDSSIMSAIVNFENEVENDTALFKSADLTDDNVVDAFDLSVVTAMANFEI